MTVAVRVAGNGRMVLPLAARKALGLQGEGQLVLTLEGEEAKLTPIHRDALEAQEIYRRHAKRHRTTDDFLADRKAEADREADHR